MTFILSDTDIVAISNADSNYINNKGADYYKEGKYALAVEYYRLATAMGNLRSVSNLGYCYLYGRDIEADLDLAIAYFRIASLRGDVDASYKLGDIYESDKWGVKDREMSVYYYRMAGSYILGDDWDNGKIAYNDELQKYPSLCFALGREMAPGGLLYTDLDSSYQFLMAAKKGYELEMANGSSFYRDVYDSVLEWLNREEYRIIRDKYEIAEDDGEVFTS